MSGVKENIPDFDDSVVKLNGRGRNLIVTSLVASVRSNRAAGHSDAAVETVCWNLEVKTLISLGKLSTPLR